MCVAGKVNQFPNTAKSTINMERSEVINWQCILVILGSFIGRWLKQLIWILLPWRNSIRQEELWVWKRILIGIKVVNARRALMPLQELLMRYLNTVQPEFAGFYCKFWSAFIPLSIRIIIEPTRLDTNVASVDWIYVNNKPSTVISDRIIECNK